MVHRIVNYGKNFALNDGSNLSLFLFCCRDLARSVYEQHCARQKKSDDDTLTLQGLMRWIVCSPYVDEAIPGGGAAVVLAAPDWSKADATADSQPHRLNA